MVESEDTQVQVQELETKEPSAEANLGDHDTTPSDKEAIVNDPNAVNDENEPSENLVKEEDSQKANGQPDKDESKAIDEPKAENAELAASDPGADSAKEQPNPAKVNELKQQLEEASGPEEKLNKTIELMEASLAQSGNPDFKTFWDSRKGCLELFKENIPPAVKALHWSKYRELTKEAKRLKEIFEEQTAFAVEQIEIAIQALENDINDFNGQLEKVSFPNFSKSLRALRDNMQIYREKQRELNLLNAQAARINALRKELIRTEMRIRQKNKFFQRLSSAGDSVFPKRKELIKEISQLFIDDINTFVKSHFSGASLEKSLHHFREEIKSLQAVAKLMTLNTHAFTHTRLKLSECWDKLKSFERERKKEQAQQKQTFKENAEEVSVKINEFAEAVTSNQLSSTEAQKKFDEINKFMRSKELGREEVKALKDQLNQAYKPVKSKLIEEEKKRREAELEREQTRQNKIKEIEERSSELGNRLNTEELEVVSKEIDSIDHEIQLLGLTEFESDGLMRQLIPVKDALAEKEEKEVLELSDSDTEKLSRLESVLNKSYDRRNEVKSHIEKYRKACGGSGLDFEQSMYFNEQLNAEKMRFEKINSNIAKLESSMAQLKR